MERRFLGILLGALALILGALGEPSRAASGPSPDGLRTLPVLGSAKAIRKTATDPPQLHSRDILARLDVPHAAPNWIARHVALDFESGFRVSGAASYGNHRYGLRLRGPVYETPLRARNYGLILELEF